MHNELILPVPVLIIHQGRITPALQPHSIVLHIILKDLGYPEELVLSANSEEQANQVTAEHLPNLVFLNIQDRSNLRAIQNIKQLYPFSYLITIHEGIFKSAEILEAIQLGADAYLLSDAPAEQQFQHLKCILSGGAILHPQLAQLLQKQFSSASNLPAHHLFSPAETQILRHISHSESPEETASSLKASEYQIYSFIKNIFRKIALQNKQKKG